MMILVKHFDERNGKANDNDHKKKDGTSFG